MNQMYPAIPFSPETVLTEAVNSTETRLFFENVSVFGPAPNLITLKANDNTGETVLMINVGPDFIDVQRGVDDTVAVAWSAGTIAGRFFTAKDQNDLQDNLRALNTQIITHTDDIDNPHEVTALQLGLENVDNTSDLDKPISNAVEQALSDKAHRIHSHTVQEVDALSDTLVRINNLAVDAYELAESKISMTLISATLYSSSWTGDNTQTVQHPDIPSPTSTSGDIRAPQNIDLSLLQALEEARPWVIAQEEGQITILARGKIPEVDIPIVMEVRQ